MKDVFNCDEVVTIEVKSSLFGARIQHLRKLKGLSQKELAKRLGKDTHSAVCNWEKGHGQPALPTFVLLCSELGVTPNDLLLPAAN